MEHVAKDEGTVTIRMNRKTEFATLLASFKPPALILGSSMPSFSTVAQRKRSIASSTLSLIFASVRLCMRSRDPYDRDEVLDVCARHSCEGHEEQFKQHGINSVHDLRAHIDKTIEREDARAFRCQPQPKRGQTVPREVYNAPLRSDASGKSYETSVVLNPNRDAQGQVYGGTCVIVNANKGEFERLSDREHEATGERPRVVTGGREALREQERHQQVLTVERQYDRPQQNRDQTLKTDLDVVRERQRRQQEELQNERKARERKNANPHDLGRMRERDPPK